MHELWEDTDGIAVDHSVSAAIAIAGKHLYQIKSKLKMNPKEVVLLVSLLRSCLIILI